eukprot:3855833-Rhodomonas_salina.3
MVLSEGGARDPVHSAISLRTCYTMPGTDVAYGGTRAEGEGGRGIRGLAWNARYRCTLSSPVLTKRTGLKARICLGNVRH